MPVLPVHTSRLRLRVMRSTDAAVLAAYRDDPDVARYQDWELPFGPAEATALLESQDSIDDLAPGRWLQIALEVSDGTVVGDLAVGLDTTGSVATLGYSLAVAHQGRGYATEATSAVVDAIFAGTGVHRIVATLDPANHASMRVIEPLGFRHEGLARRAAPVRGTWADDLRFALLREDRADWLARPLSRPAVVELTPVTADLLPAVLRLETFRFQRAFVAPMDASLAQALVPGEHEGRPVTPWYRAVVADGVVAGFVMMAEADAGTPVPYLWRLLIDRAHQRRGIGRQVIARLVRTWAAAGFAAMLVSWESGPGGPEPFYRGLGFVPTGEMDGDETMARLEFAHLGRRSDSQV